MKNIKDLCAAFSICAAMLVLSTMTGCRGVDFVKFSNTLPGIYDLSGVSKIAVIDFNTMPDDPVAGVYAADTETRKIVEDMIAAQFFKGKTYKIADLDVERNIAELKSNAKLAKRFDAILYGRVWWKKSAEIKNIHPEVDTLETWDNVRYMAGRDNDGRPFYRTEKVTQKKEQVKVDHRYRAQNATLMVSLTLYRLDRNGKIEKIVEDFVGADQTYLLDNGVFSTTFVPLQKVKLSKFERIAAQSENQDEKKAKASKEKAGYIDEWQNANTIPTSLQTKIMLSKKISEMLGRKMTNVEVPVSAEFFGTYMFFSPIEEETLNMIISGKFARARKILVTTIRKKAGYDISNRIGSLSAYAPEK
ncbi:MAG: hypothetical protein IKA22_14010, partial [Lentisphaeria bacterium]|nr:hypothetical protein [Lentisphaeria bacterium]